MSLATLRIIYGFAVSLGVLAAAKTLQEVRREYKILRDTGENGPALFLAYSHTRDAWERLYMQTALFAILVLGGFIHTHAWEPEEAIYRGWITVLHTSLTLVSTWKSIRTRRYRHILADMIRMHK